jgi:hypothetical protein
LNRIILVLLVILILILTTYKAYIMITPEIVVSNLSATLIRSVSIQLPNNRIVFGDIAPKSSSTILYSVDQTDGTYKYIIIFGTGETVTNECGYITDNEIGKVFQITIKSVEEIKCSSK